MIRFEIPQPPSANTLYTNVPGIGRVRSTAYKRWLADAGWTLQTLRPGSIAGPVCVTYTIPRPKDRRRRDIDNLAKPLNDLLVRHGVIEDDSCVQKITLEYGDVPAVAVLVEAA